MLMGTAVLILTLVLGAFLVGAALIAIGAYGLARAHDRAFREECQENNLAIRMQQKRKPAKAKMKARHALAA